MKQKHLLKAVLICLCLLSTTVESHAQNMEIYEPKAKEQVLPTPTSRAYIRYPGYQPDCCIQDHFLESLANPGLQGPGYMERMPSYDLDYWDIPLYMLKSITMPHQTIEFTNEKQNDEVYLRQLTVKNQAGSTVKECRLGTGGYTLGSLYISGEGTYEFDYYGGGYMDCRSQDFWGYYNGKPNTTTVPSFQIYIESFTSRLYAFNGADRRIDPEAMQNYQLKRVTYPTKGYMEWEYEPHRFSPRLAYGLLINGSNMSYLSERRNTLIRI